MMRLLVKWEIINPKKTEWTDATLTQHFVTFFWSSAAAQEREAAPLEWTTFESCWLVITLFKVWSVPERALHSVGPAGPRAVCVWLMGWDICCCCCLLANCACCPHDEPGTHAAGDTLVAAVDPGFGRRACASADETVPVGLKDIQVVDLPLFSDVCWPCRYTG